ncbi:polysaccharide lyase [Pontibacter sp. HJ8]
MGKVSIVPLVCTSLIWMLATYFACEIAVAFKMENHPTKVELVLNKYNINFPLTFWDDGNAKPLKGNILFTETFDGNDPLATAVSLQTGTEHGFKIVPDPVYRRAKSGRFELRATDPMVHRGKRSELFVTNRTTHNERWYSFAAFFPANSYTTDTSNELISQWHQNGSPPISLRIVNDRFYLRVLHNSKDTSWKVLDLAPVTKDTWHEFIFHIVHSAGNDALIEVWHNGQKLVHYTGRNNIESEKMPYWKIGIYKAKWNNSRTDSDLRVVYFDDISVGNEHASFAEMTSTFKKQRKGTGFGAASYPN